ncbi:MAG TPA: DUF357 domain-containing protein [Candidatus Aenigmarchaeota archaeon]|nr:DUF357 domain-containing protein [Candidatus Aenigmarchaeota archaeon]
MCDGTSLRLKEETEKWLKKLEERTVQIRRSDSRERKRLDDVINNMHAYISDCRHFLNKGDYINAFEAIIYAWGIYETCIHLGLLKGQIHRNGK